MFEMRLRLAAGAAMALAVLASEVCLGGKPGGGGGGTGGGNMVAALTGNTLYLTGDAADNGVFITLDDGVVHVGSIVNTTINGATDLWLNVDPTRLNLVIDGRGGNDKLWVNIATVTMASDISIQGGDGNDYLFAGTVDGAVHTLLGSVSIDAGNGDDLVELGGDILGDANIVGGFGADQMTFRPVGIGGDLLLAAGDGNDMVSFAVDTIVGGMAVLDGGRNRDAITLPSALATAAELYGFESVTEN